MIAVIIAGGSGTRLWPLSTPSYPKQFLKINGSDRSLLQATYDRVKGVASDVYLVTSSEIYDESAKQLHEIKSNIIVEPSRRGVANALYLAFRRLKQDGVSDNEPVFVLWGDHLIHAQKAFHDTINEATEAIKSGASLIQFGIVPSHPSNQLGYIKKGSSNQYGENVFEIAAWKYQPEQATANKWFATGDYLWNAGYFMSTMDYVMSEIKRESPESYAEYETIVAASDKALDETYNSQEGAILDHVLSEKMKGAHAIACTFDWIDIGNFHDMHSISPLGTSNNYIKGEVEYVDVSESFLQNQLDIPIAVVGLDNVVVVATKNGILVANKSQARKVGDVAKQVIAKQEGK